MAGFSLGKRTMFLTMAMLLLAGLVSLRASDPWPVRYLRTTYFDYLQRLAPRAFTPLPVYIVDLDEASLSQLGQWPWPRDRLADMVDRLAAFGAAVIVFDVLFPEPDRLSPRNLIRNPAVRRALSSGSWMQEIDKLDNDVAFARAIGRTPVVLGIADAGALGGQPAGAKAGFAFVGLDPREGLLPLRSATPIVPVLAEAASGIGVVNVNPLAESDTIREVPLVWRTAAGNLPGLALEALRVALGASTIIVTGPNAAPNRIDEVRVGDYAIPTLPNGLFPLYFRHEDPSRYIPAHRVLNDDDAQALAPLLGGSIVFIGASAAGLSDTRTTALGERVSGVSIQAQIVEQILLETYLVRTDVTQGLEVAVLIALGVLVSFALVLTGPVPSVLIGGLAGAVILAVSWFAFSRSGVLFDVTFPLIGGFVAFSVLAMYQFAVSDREKRLIRRSLARYVAPSVLQEINRKGYTIELGGKTGEVTVLFCDIRNFTPLAASMPAQDLVTLLNDVFSDLSDEILAESGTIDKYIGDEIMAFWNAPLPTERHQTHACLATLGMRRSIARYNARTALKGAAPLAVGMGLDCGQACVGNIGSRNRFNYTAIGETVNIAARTQGVCRHVGYDIVVTAAVARSAPTLAFLPAGRVKMKGVATRTEVFVLVGDEAVAASQAFLETKSLFDGLIADVVAGGRDGQTLAARVEAASEATDPDLRAFFQGVLRRAADYR